MTTKDKYIQKLEEQIKALKISDWGSVDSIESDLSSLKAEMEKEDKPVKSKKEKQSFKICAGR